MKYTSSEQRNFRNYSSTVHKSSRSADTGWKLHFNYNKSIPKKQIEDLFDQHGVPAWKEALFGSDEFETAKHITAYVGDRDKAIAVANDLNSTFKGSLQTNLLSLDEEKIGDGVTARFTVEKNDYPKVNQYGYAGLSLSNEQMYTLSGVQRAGDETVYENTKKSYVASMAHAYEQEFGTFFSGSTEETKFRPPELGRELSTQEIASVSSVLAPINKIASAAPGVQTESPAILKSADPIASVTGGVSSIVGKVDEPIGVAPVSSRATSSPVVSTSGPRPEPKTPEELFKRNGKIPQPRDSKGRFVKAPTYSIPSADFSPRATTPIPSRRMIESFPSYRDRTNSTAMNFITADIYLDPHKRAYSGASYSGLDVAGDSNWEGLDSKNVISESKVKPNIENDMRLVSPRTGRVAKDADTMGWSGTEAPKFNPKKGPSFDRDLTPVYGVVNPRQSQSTVFANEDLPSLRDFPSLNDPGRLGNLRNESSFDSLPPQRASVNELALHTKDIKGPILFEAKSVESIASKAPRTNWKTLGAGLVGGAIIGRHFAGDERDQKTAGMTMGGLVGMGSANFIYNEYASQEKSIVKEYRKSLREAGSLAERPALSPKPQDYIGDPKAQPSLLEGRSPHQITDRISLTPEGLKVDPTTTTMKYEAASVRLKTQARARANSARTKNKMITAGLAVAAAVATAGVGLSFSGGDKSSGINSQRGL